jgi:hypothetical protein
MLISEKCSVLALVVAVAALAITAAAARVAAVVMIFRMSVSSVLLPVGVGGCRRPRLSVAGSRVVVRGCESVWPIG